jgi:putative photosynthetic complex assembly protein 2
LSRLGKGVWMSILLDMAPPALFVIFVWWVSTGLIFAMNGLPERTYATSLGIVALLAALSVAVLWTIASGTTRTDAAITLVATIMVWAVIEMSFLMGVVTGPRRLACPLDATEWQRFRAACLAIAYHEAAIVVTLALLWWLTADKPNTLGATTFGLLWLMRLSTKLNIFFGVPNPAAELLPPRISYLKSYFRQAPMSFFFPLSVTMATAATGYFLSLALAAPAGSFDAQAAAILAALAALGVIEHWFLVLPFQPEALWGWSLGSRTDTKPIPANTSGPGRETPRRDPLVPRVQTQT